MNNTKLKLCFILALALAFSLPALSQVQSEPDTSDLLWFIETYPTEVYCVRFSPDGKYVAVGQNSQNPLLYETETGKLVKEFLCYNNDKIASLDFSPDGKHLATANIGEEVFLKIWDVETGENIKTLLKDYPDYKTILGVAWISYSRDGNYLLCKVFNSLYKEDIVLIDLKTEKIIKRIQDIKDLYKPILSPDGKIIAYTTVEMSTEFWVTLLNVDDMTEKGKIGPFSTFLHDLTFSEDGKLLATAGYYDSVRIWNLDTKKIEKTLYFGHTGHSLKFYNNFIIIGSQDWTNTLINIFDMENNKLVYQYHNNYIIDYSNPKTIDISQNGKYISVGGIAGIAVLKARWDGTTVKEDNKNINIFKLNPNPNNDTALIIFSLLQSGIVKIELTDLTGKIKSTIKNEYFNIGYYEIPFSTIDLTKGTYFCTITLNNTSQTIKLIKGE